MATVMKPILVTGATGSIGLALVKRLAENRRPVRALARSLQRASLLSGLPGVEVVTGDLTKPDSLRGCAEGCNLVYHCAAKLQGTNRADYEAINVTGTRALLAEAVRAGVERFVYASTIGVYGFSQAESITEDFPWPVIDIPYFTTKQAAERIVQEAMQQLPVSIARIGDVIGPGQYTWTIGNILKVKQGLLNPPTQRASGTLNPVYIDNLIDALVLMGTHPAAAGQIFNVVDGTPISTSDYLRRLARMAGKHPVALPSFFLYGAVWLLMISDQLRGREPEYRPADIGYLLHKATISNQKIRALLGWQPAISLEEAFKRTEDWLRREKYIA